MYILSLDTAAKTAAVGVSRLSEDDGVLFPLTRAAVNATLTHSESLLPMIDFCLKNAGLSFADVGAVAVSAGPGSFTGVRIGIATVKGLAFGRPELPCIGVSTLEALACNIAASPARRVLLPVMDARRNQFYHAFFRPGRGTKSAKVTPVKRLSADALLTFDEIAEQAARAYPGKKAVLVGDGAEAFYRLYRQSGRTDFDVELCGYDVMYEDAFSVARVAAQFLCADGEASAKTYTFDRLNPVYLRASQAERERNSKPSERGH